MKRRVIALVAALLLAGVGTFVLVGFVRGASDRASAGQDLAEVYLIRLPVPEGTAGEDIANFVERGEVLVDSLSPDAVTDLSVLEGFVAETDMFVNDQLTAKRWITPEEAANEIVPILEERITVPAGHMTLPISLAAENALGGTVQAGQTVAVVGSFGAYPTGGDADTVDVGGDVVAIPDSAGDANLTEAATHIVLDNVLVVEVLAAAPPNFAPTIDGQTTPLLAPTGTFTVTFALEPKDVERMVFLAQNGDIWLALQTPDDDGPTSIVTLDDIFTD